MLTLSLVNKTLPRLPTAKRRLAILAAVRETFAEKGFHGTTTRELARAAGISEALMLRHFPTKDALYAAVLQSSCHRDPKTESEFRRLMALPPSTSTLVLIVNVWFARIIQASQRAQAGAGSLHKLMLQSLQGNGGFARVFLKRGPALFISKIEQCLDAAIKAGDAVRTPVKRNLRGWFAHHLAATILLYCLPEAPVVDYAMSREKLSEQAALFALRGMGLKDKAITRHRNPKAL